MEYFSFYVIIFCLTTQIGNRLCSAPDTPIVHRGPVNIQFVSDSSVSKEGFRFRYSVHPCGGNVTQETVISSPMHPRDIYHHNADCRWNITAPPGETRRTLEFLVTRVWNNNNERLFLGRVVGIKFTSFDVEGSRTCSYDYVAAYEGANVTRSSLIGKLCGNQTASMPPMLKSYSNSMTLR